MGTSSIWMIGVSAQEMRNSAIDQRRAYMRSRLSLLTLVLLLICVPAAFTQQQRNNDTYEDPTARVFQLVLPSEHLLGSWGGLRPKLEESGVTPRLTLVTDTAGNPSGGR